MKLNKPNMKWEAPASALARWQPEIKAKADDEEDSDSVTVNIYSTIGDYGYGDGMTAKIMSGILRKAEGRAVNVNINSPGGDFFEGVTLYNILKEYSGQVNVKIVGLAASAASIVAMAGDTVEIAKSAFFMIHNSWTFAFGNKHDMEEVAAMLSKFDKSMLDLYAEKTGMQEKELLKIMDAETWLDADESVSKGFATGILGEEEIELDEDEDKEYNASLKKVDVSLAKAGVPRSERRALIKNLIGTPCAAEEPTPTPCAGNETLTNALQALLKSTTN